MFSLLIALAEGDLEKSAALPRWTGFRHMAPAGGLIGLIGVGTGGGMLASFAPLITLDEGDVEKLAALPRLTGFRHILTEGESTAGGIGLLGLVGSSGNIQRQGPSILRHPSRMLCPSGWMTDTAVLVKTIL